MKFKRCSQDEIKIDLIALKIKNEMPGGFKSQFHEIFLKAMKETILKENKDLEPIAIWNNPPVNLVHVASFKKSQSKITSLSVYMIDFRLAGGGLESWAYDVKDAWEHDWSSLMAMTSHLNID